MYQLTLLFALLCTIVTAYPLTYEDVRGTPYTVSYDHRAININGQRTMLIGGVIHYPRSTPGMWPYLFQMAKKQGLNTIQTYVFWNIHEQKQGVLDFSGRANLSKFLQDAADAGLFVNLRIGPYVCAEWNYGGLPVWLNQVPDISFRSHNAAWEAAMKKFVLEIVNYATPYLAKNGGPIILAQIENEYNGNDMAYVDWCGSLVSNELAPTQIPWIMCNGHAANSTIETCNSCNCQEDGWMDRHRQSSPSTPMLFTENEGWFQPWGDAVAIRTPDDLGRSVAEWFAYGGAYHAYYMWHGGNNYGRTAGSGITTMYADDVCLHADGTPNEPKYTHLGRLQHLVANYAEVMLSQDYTRIDLPWWDGKQWANGTQQHAIAYPPSLYFVRNEATVTVNTLLFGKNLTLYPGAFGAYDNQGNLLWDYKSYSNIVSDISTIVPVVTGPLEWQIWSEPAVSNLPVVSSPAPLDQLVVTNDETVYMWYRRNVTFSQPSYHTSFDIDTRKANALVFFVDGQYLGEYDNHEHAQGGITASVAFDLSTFKPNQQYQLQILSVTLGLDNGIWAGGFEHKGLAGNVKIDGQLIPNDPNNQWEHQKGLVGEYYQIFTEQGSSKVPWDTQWAKGVNKPITWFQARFDLDHLINKDTNANPVLLDATGLNRGHAYINGNDLGVFWLIQGVCHDTTPCCCQQAQINCMEPTQRYYHIPSDWLLPKNNLLTIFDELGAPSPASVRLVQRVISA